MRLEMIKPTPGMEKQVLRFRDDFYDAGERVINGSAGLDFYPDYATWIDYLDRIERGEEEGFVPSRVWLARDAETDKLVGILDIRPDLPKEKEGFGHIGYSTHPAHRRQGVAAKMLHWGTRRLKEDDVSPIIVCCYQYNTASQKLLEQNSYHLADSYLEEESGKTVLIYHYNGIHT